MAKKAAKRKVVKARKPKASTAPRLVSHRVTTFKANGGAESSMEVAPDVMPVGEAMRIAVEALGDITIDNELAPKQLRELADCYEDVTSAQAAFNAKSEAAKVAKKSLESVTNLLLEKVRSFTHPIALPLFDQAQAESDHEDMLAGGDVMDGD